MRGMLAAALLPLALHAAEHGLTIENAGVHVREDGPNVPPNFRFRAGEYVYFSFQVSGYRTQGVDMDTRKVELSWHIAVEDANGTPLAEPGDEQIATTVSPEDRNWRPIGRRAILLPPLMPAGRYRFLLEVHDALAKTMEKADVPFLVAGYTVEPGAPLGVRNFRFLRGADDTEPLEIPAYRPGDTLWARFDIAGFEIGEKNRYSVEYGLRVLRPDGTVAFEQRHAAQAEDEPFYPQRIAPGVLGLPMPRDIAKAHYTLVVTVRDRLSGKTCEARAAFSVE